MGKLVRKGVSRRTILKGMGLLGATVALSGCSKSSEDTFIIGDGGSTEEPVIQEERIYSAGCRSNCQSACGLNIHSRNGRVVRVTKGEYLSPNNTYIDKDGSEVVVPYDLAQTAYRSYERICLRGVSHVQRMYSKERLQTPLIRPAGVARGDVANYVSATWDEALDIVAENIHKNYDPINEGESIYMFAGSGNAGLVHGKAGGLMAFGGYLNTSLAYVAYDYSFSAGLCKVIGQPDFMSGGNELLDMKNAKTIILWGSNMAEAHIAGWPHLLNAKEAGARLISIDVMANSTSAKSDYFYRVNSGTDLAMVLAMIRYVTHDYAPDVDTNTALEISGLNMRQYLLHNTDAPLLIYGKADGTWEYVKNGTDYYVYDRAAGSIVPGSMVGARLELPSNYDDFALIEPAGFSITHPVSGATITAFPVYTKIKESVTDWTFDEAAKYTGVSAQNMQLLVDMYLEGPSTIYASYGLSHHYNSSDLGFAIGVLGAITGNMGHEGAGVGVIGANFSGGIGKIGVPSMMRHKLPMVMAEKMRAGTSKIKMLVCFSGNPLSNNTDAKRDYIDTIFKEGVGAEFIVTADLKLTETARYSDVILPVCHWFEAEDISAGSKSPFLSYQEKASNPLHNSKSDMDIARMLAQKLISGPYQLPATVVAGLNKFFFVNGRYKTDWEYIEAAIASAKPTTRVSTLNIKKQKFIRTQDPKKIYIGFEGANPGEVQTKGATGRFTMFSENPYNYIGALVNRPELISMRGVLTPAGVTATISEQFIKWAAPDEVWGGEGATQAQKDLATEYPFIFIQEHARWRVHTQWTEVPWLRDLDPEPVLKINPTDAASKGVQTGDLVKISNNRGHCVFRAIITPALPQGLLNAPKGWQRHKFTEAFGDKVADPGSYNDVTNAKVHLLACDHIFYDVRVKLEKI